VTSQPHRDHEPPCNCRGQNECWYLGLPEWPPSSHSALLNYSSDHHAQDDPELNLWRSLYRELIMVSIHSEAVFSQGTSCLCSPPPTHPPTPGLDRAKWRVLVGKVWNTKKLESKGVKKKYSYVLRGHGRQRKLGAARGSTGRNRETGMDALFPCQVTSSFFFLFHTGSQCSTADLELTIPQASLKLMAILLPQPSV